MKVPSAALWFALGVCFGVVLAPATAWAEDRPARDRSSEARERRGEARRAQRTAERRQARTPRSTRAERRKARAARRSAPARPAPAAAVRAPTASAADEIVREGDTSVKVMRFSGLDIEGRLKSPQLLVFVERVRAEFERPALPHRSFMPELRDTAAREPVR